MIEVSNDKVVLCSFDAMGYLSVAFAIAIIPLSLILPEWISWENGPLEDLQVVVLALGVFLTAVFAKKACSKKIQHMEIQYIYKAFLHQCLMIFKSKWFIVFQG